MANTGSKVITAIFLLFIVVAGYQAITQTGTYIAEVILKMPEVDFWILAFILLLVIGILVFGITPSKILKEL